MPSVAYDVDFLLAPMAPCAPKHHGGPLRLRYHKSTVKHVPGSTRSQAGLCPHVSTCLELFLPTSSSSAAKLCLQKVARQATSALGASSLLRCPTVGNITHVLSCIVLQMAAAA